jgi:hypothetical protein
VRRAAVLLRCTFGRPNGRCYGAIPTRSSESSARARAVGKKPDQRQNSRPAGRGPIRSGALAPSPTPPLHRPSPKPGSLVARDCPFLESTSARGCLSNACATQLLSSVTHQPASNPPSECSPWHGQSREHPDRLPSRSLAYRSQPPQATACAPFTAVALTPSPTRSLDSLQHQRFVPCPLCDK